MTISGASVMIHQLPRLPNHEETNAKHLLQYLRLHSGEKLPFVQVLSCPARLPTMANVIRILLNSRNLEYTHLFPSLILYACLDLSLFDHL